MQGILIMRVSVCDRVSLSFSAIIVVRDLQMPFFVILPFTLSVYTSCLWKACFENLFFL